MAAIGIHHMNAGEGETSFANNSLLQKTVFLKARPFLEETLKDVLSLSTSNFPGSFSVADLGCSSGPNTLLFQSAFKSDDQNVNPHERCFIYGVPGSFYHRLFPTGSIHFIHSSYSVHWLSKVPENLWNNKRNKNMAKSSPAGVYRAYLEQFQRDFSLFITLRAEELVRGGRMFLTLIGRSIADPSSRDCCCIWELLTKSLLELVDEELVEEAGVDSFNMPYYNPCEEEVREIVLKQGSFNLDKFETFEVNWDPSDDVSDTTYVFDKDRSGQNAANSVRAVTETMLATHFGEGIIKPLFTKYAKRVADHLALEKTKHHFNLVISMTKK